MSVAVAEPESLIALDHTDFTYAPFPMGVIRPVFHPKVYAEMVESFPPLDAFVYKPALGHKYSLSEVNNPGLYREFVRSTPVWRDFLAEIKSGDFTERWLRLLVDRGIDLGLLDQPHVPRLRHLRSSVGRMRRRQISSAEFARRLRNRPRRTELNTRFEFSMLPASGGNIKPHTDAPQKLITLVFSIVGPGEWDPAWGGGTNMDAPLDERRTFNHMNEQLEFDEVEPFRTFDFEPNQCVVFIKTFNSLHSVPPMTGPEGVMRRTLTLNIERAGYV